MEKYSRKNLRNIQTIVQEETGATLTANRKLGGYNIRRMALIAGCMLCFVMLCAFSYAKFSILDGDDLGFAPAYQGEGRFEIVIMNFSDKELKLQDKVKVMQWSTSEEVAGNREKIRMSGLTIAPHSQGIVTIDISEGYDVEAMEENLQEGDWYYFLLTNNNFAFGQDWMCSFDFEKESVEDVEHRLTVVAGQRVEGQDAAELRAEGQDAVWPEYNTDNLIYSDWIWPTVSRKVSAPYGEGTNGIFMNHIIIAGTIGDEIYAVADGIVTEAAYVMRGYGNSITVDLGDGIVVKYWHLQEMKVSVGDEIVKGQVIATMGVTGLATGPILSFEVTIDGEKVNPLTVEE